MSKKITYYSILVILIIGLFGAGGLVVEEFKTGEGCPKIMHIPMCLVILICFIVPLIAHLLKKWNVVYFLFTGLAGSIALVASIMQFTGNAECPKTASGTPMCYYSLLLFNSLIILKIYHLKSNNQK
jgi:phosphatidylserine synthase